jgi:hypothetical protein
MKKLFFVSVIVMIALAIPKASQSTEKQLPSLGATSKNLDGGFPVSYYCGYFYNNDMGNGLPLYTPIYVFSDTANHSSVFAVGYYDSNNDAVTVYVSGTFNTSTNYADISDGLQSIYSGTLN